MSRIRSHLDAVMATSAGMASGVRMQANPAEPRRAFPSAPPVSAPHVAAGQTTQSHRELEAIQKSLDDLAGKIASMPRAVTPPQPPLELQRRNEAAFADLRGEVSRGFEQIRSEFGRNTHQLADALNQDIKRIADGISALQNSQNVHPEYVDQMQAELQNLHQGIRQISERQASMPVSQVDLSGVSRSIETGYSEIVTKLDQVLANRGSELPVLPDLNIPDYSGEFKALRSRLEEVTRAVVSMTVSPGNSVDHHALERIEARLASLSKAVDELQDGNSPAAGFDAALVADLASHQETVAAELVRLSQRLEAMEQGQESGSSLLADVQAIASRIDALQSDLGVISAHLDRGADGEGLSAASSPMPFEMEAMQDWIAGISSIEQRMESLAERLEALPAQTENTHAGSQEILALLRDIGGRVEAIERLAAESPDDGGANGYAPVIDNTFLDDRFANLESQLAVISSQLGTLPEGATPASAGFAQTVDLSPLAERLDHIEGQLAASRDIVIDIATEAARRATEELPRGEAGQLQDLPQLEELLDELRMLRENGLPAAPAGDSGMLGEISTAIHSISERLARFEEMASAPADHHTESAGVAAYQSEPAYSEHAGVGNIKEHAFPATGHAVPDVSLPEFDNTPPMAPVEADAYAMEEPAAAMHSGHQQGEADVEDIPLEPGSGMPDLEALVRRASNRKREKANAPKAETQEDDGIGDLMAAARRAAQAASAQAEVDRVKEEAKSSKGSRLGKLRSGGKPSIFSRKALMMSAAVVALAVAGWMIVPKFLGGAEPQPAPEVSQVIEEERSLTEPESSDEDIAAIEEEIAEEGEAEPRIVGDQEQLASDGQSGSPLMDPSAESASGFESRDAAATRDAPETAALPPSNTDGFPAEIGNEALLQDAASGDGNALFEIGRRYTDGVGVDRNLEEAAKWYRKAAEAGHGPAQYRLGNFYEKGHGVEADVAQAAAWYEQAAAAGNALAMHNLAVLNVQGLIGSDPDMETAIGWFEKAANLGVKDSQVNLGILYTRGMGVDADLEQAYKWFAVAARGGDNDAAGKRDTVAKNMRPDQLEKARGEAELWQPQALDRAANTADVKDSWKDGAAKANVELSRAEMVRRTQFILGKMGYDAGPADGIFGAKTEQAIRAFQQKSGLAVDGKVSPELIEALAKLAV